MAENNPHQESSDSHESNGSASAPPRRRRRAAGSAAGAPVFQAPTAPAQNVTTSAASQSSTVVTDAAPVNFRERRRRAAASTAGAPAASTPDAQPAAAETSTAEKAPKTAKQDKPAQKKETAKAAKQDKTTQKKDTAKAPASGSVADDLQALADERKDETASAAPAGSAPSTDFTSLLFQAPTVVKSASAGDDDDEDSEDEAAGSNADSSAAEKPRRSRTRSRRRSSANADHTDDDTDDADGDDSADSSDSAGSDDSGDEGESRGSSRRRRRRGGRGRRGRGRSDDDDSRDDDSDEDDSSDSDDSDDSSGSDDESTGGSSSRRRRRRRRSSGSSDEPQSDDPPNTVVKVREARDEVRAVKGSTRLEAKRQRRREGRDAGRRRHSITEAEFLARRESVKRSMIVRERPGRTQIAVLEDNILVEHYVAQKSQVSMVGNVYLGKVQNVLPSMEAAFVDIGKGRNAVLYAGEVNWDAAGLEGQPRRIELALKAGDPVLVQVTKDPIGHKGARLPSQISLPGRYLVFVPGGSMTGISRKLPENERNRLKKILKTLVPEEAGVIVRTAAEGASEEELKHDVERLQAQWAKIEKKRKSKNAPAPLSTEPDLAIKVVRDIFNEDFTALVVEGENTYKEVHEYVSEVAPDLLDRTTKHVGERDSFAKYRVDEQLMKAMDRKVYLPSGGSLVIDRTEAMTVVDVNTGKFTGSGGSLEETVTRNNLEAAEEIVRQLRLRDIGGIIVIDFIDMVLEANRDLVMRRLVECLSRDRTKHQVAEVTSLGLVQMTRKRVGAGLVETFSTSCEHCNGRGITIDLDGHQHHEAPAFDDDSRGGRSRRSRSKRSSQNDHGKHDHDKHSQSQAGDAQGGDQAGSSRPDAARDAVQELVDQKNGSDVHVLEQDETSRAIAAATIASIAAATSKDSHPEVTVDGQVISASDASAQAPAESGDQKAEPAAEPADADRKSEAPAETAEHKEESTNQE